MSTMNSLESIPKNVYFGNGHLGPPKKGFPPWLILVEFVLGHPNTHIDIMKRKNGYWLKCPGWPIFLSIFTGLKDGDRGSYSHFLDHKQPTRPQWVNSISELLYCVTG